MKVMMVQQFPRLGELVTVQFHDGTRILSRLLSTAEGLQWHSEELGITGHSRYKFEQFHPSITAWEDTK